MNVFIQSFQYGQGVTQGQFLSGIKWVWIQLFFSLSDCLTKQSLPFYLPKTWG